MFLLGFATGTIAGVILMALCVASRESEDREEKFLEEHKDDTSRRHNENKRMGSTDR